MSAVALLKALGGHHRCDHAAGVCTVALREAAAVDTHWPDYSGDLPFPDTCDVPEMGEEDTES